MAATLKPRWSVAFPRQFDSVSREMDQVFEHFFGNGSEDASGWSAPASLWEEEGRWCIEVDLPGVKLENIDITLEKNALRLTAERHGPEDRKFYHQERAYGRSERVITLPETVDSERIEAELKDGVLRLTLDKKPELQPKKIQVKAN